MGVRPLSVGEGEGGLSGWLGLWVGMSAVSMGVEHCKWLPSYCLGYLLHQVAELDSFNLNGAGYWSMVGYWWSIMLHLSGINGVLVLMVVGRGRYAGFMKGSASCFVMCFSEI